MSDAIDLPLQYVAFLRSEEAVHAAWQAGDRVGAFLVASFAAGQSGALMEAYRGSPFLYGRIGMRAAMSLHAAGHCCAARRLALRVLKVRGIDTAASGELLTILGPSPTAAVHE